MSIEFTVTLVDSTSHAMRIEKLLKKHGLLCKLIPVPRHLSSDCGVCVRIRKQDMDMIKALLKEHHITIQSMEAL